MRSISRSDLKSTIAILLEAIASTTCGLSALPSSSLSRYSARTAATCRCRAASKPLTARTWTPKTGMEVSNAVVTLRNFSGTGPGFRSGVTSSFAGGSATSSSAHRGRWMKSRLPNKPTSQRRLIQPPPGNRPLAGRQGWFCPIAIPVRSDRN